MNLRKLARLEKRVPALMVRALDAAQGRALASGVPVLVVADGGLYRVTPAGRELVEPMPPRARVTARTKRATS